MAKSVDDINLYMKCVLVSEVISQNNGTDPF